MNETTENKLRLERETCSRCGGSGQYSYCQMYGSRCFKCAGKKEVLTKRGAVAYAYLETLRSKPASELKVGDRVWYRGIVLPGAICEKSGWTTVRVVRPGEVSDGGRVTKDEQGNEIVTPSPFIVETDRCKHHCSADSTFRVFISKEHELETLQQAIAYQETLTKTGKPRKQPK